MNCTPKKLSCACEMKETEVNTRIVREKHIARSNLPIRAHFSVQIEHDEFVERHSYKHDSASEFLNFENIKERFFCL